MHSIATNQQVADALEVDVSMASRLRSGSRHPSIGTMMRIQEVWEWPIGRQARHLLTGDYGVALERILCEHYGAATPQV